VGCRGTDALCSSLPFYTFPNPNVENMDKASRNKALLRDWKAKIRKQNLVLTASNNARVCGAHFPELHRSGITSLWSAFS